MLLDSGLDPNVGDDQETALMGASVARLNKNLGLGFRV